MNGGVMIHESIADATAFGRAVRLARKERGLSQRALAEQCACSQRFISELERGKPTAEVGKAIHVLAVLGVRLYAETSDVRGNAREAVDMVTSRIAANLSKATSRATLSDYL